MQKISDVIKATTELLVKLLTQTPIDINTAVSRNKPKYEPAAAPESIPAVDAR